MLAEVSGAGDFIAKSAIVTIIRRNIGFETKILVGERNKN